MVLSAVMGTIGEYVAGIGRRGRCGLESRGFRGDAHNPVPAELDPSSFESSLPTSLRTDSLRLPIQAGTRFLPSQAGEPLPMGIRRRDEEFLAVEDRWICRVGVVAD